MNATEFLFAEAMPREVVAFLTIVVACLAFLLIGVLCFKIADEKRKWERDVMGDRSGRSDTDSIHDTHWGDTGQY